MEASIICSSLTDDILIEIFSHLPLNSIYKLKSLSKVWLSNLSNPNFISKWYQINQKSLPWILYQSINQPPENPSKFIPAYPELHSHLISRNENLLSFKFLVDQIPFQGAKLFLLGSSNGLVLCYSVNSENQKRYHVCNPLTQKWVSLPSRLSSGFGVSRLFCVYSSSYTSCFKVVYIPNFGKISKKFDVEIFSSDLGVWECVQVSCGENIDRGYPHYNNAVIFKSVLYWILGSNKMLVYSLNQNNGSHGHQCSLIDLPDNGADFCYINSRMGESEGCLCCAKTTGIGSGMTVSVWVLNEVHWKILHRDVSVGGTLVELHSQMDGVAPIQVVGFSPVDRNVVLLGCKHWVRGFNLQTRSFENLCLDHKQVYDAGVVFLPFVLKPMPTVLPSPSWIHN